MPSLNLTTFHEGQTPSFVHGSNRGSRRLPPLVCWLSPLVNNSDVENILSGDEEINRFKETSRLYMVVLNLIN